MLDHRDLRIGNWYYCANPMEGGKLYFNQFGCWTEYLDFEAYGEPIPLTKEILEKCDCSEIIITENCKYLHQLQNLYFALTNSELNIKL